MFIKKLIQYRIPIAALLVVCSVLFAPIIPGYFKGAVNAQATSLPAEYVGVWKGRGTQSGSEWSILLALTPGEVRTTLGTIAYPSLACGGELTLRGVRIQSIELSEHLTYPGNCVNDGIVSLRPTSNGQLRYEWFYANGSLAATGSLQKLVLKKIFNEPSLVLVDDIY
ncbi:hypothetical protein HC928_24220 [bacterium]|nr:hypothetical protein [bacterium]